VVAIFITGVVFGPVEDEDFVVSRTTARVKGVEGTPVEGCWVMGSVEEGGMVGEVMTGAWVGG